jgi:hypothetical protein
VLLINYYYYYLAEIIALRHDLKIGREASAASGSKMVAELTPIGHPDNIGGNLQAAMHLMNDTDSYAGFMVSFFPFSLGT